MALSCPELRAQQAGNVDPSFDASLGLSAGVFTIALQADGKLLAGGDFSEKVTRLDANGNRDATFDTGTATDSEFYTVKAISLAGSGGQIIVGGLFNDIGGVPRFNLARLNPNGQVDSSFVVGQGTAGDIIGQSNSAGEIDAIAVQADGGILIGGNFSSYQGASRHGIARVLTTGELDPSFDPSALFASGELTADVTSLAVQSGGNILVGSSSGLFRLLANGVEDTSFHSDVVGSGSGFQVKTLALQGDKVIVGGYLTTERVAGIAHEIFYRLNSDGSLDNSFATGDGEGGDIANFPIKEILVLPDGRVLVGGEFKTYNGSTRPGIALLSRDGVVDESFNPTAVGAGGTVSGLAYDTATQKVSLVKNQSVLRLNLDGSPDATFSPTVAPGPDGPVWAIARQPDAAVILGGQFSQVNGLSYPMIIRLLPDGSIDPDFKALDVTGQSYTSIYAVVLQDDGKILIGGEFNLFGYINLARLNADGSFDGAFNAKNAVVSGGRGVTTLAMQADGKILAGGEFTRTRPTGGVVPAGNHLVRLLANGDVDTGFDVGNAVSGGLDDLATFAVAVTPDNKILVGGNFDVNRGLATVNYLIQFTADGQVDSGFHTDVLGPAEQVFGVRAIKVQTDGKILIGGDFSMIGGASRNGVARLNKDGSLDGSFDPGSGFGGGKVVVKSIDFQGADIIIGGDFQSYSGAPVGAVVRVASTGVLDLGFSVSTNDSVNAVLVQPSDQTILLGGYTTIVDGSIRNFAARLAVNGALDIGFDPGGGTTSISALAVQDDGLIVAGGNLGSNPRLEGSVTQEHRGVTLATNARGSRPQSRNDGIKHGHLSRFTPHGVVDPDFNIGDGPDGLVAAIGLQSDGGIVIGGDFATFNGSAASRIARINKDGSIDAFFNANGSGFDGTVRSVAILADQSIAVGGDFTHYNGAVATRLAHLSSSGSLDQSFASAQGADAPVRVIAQLADGSGRLLIGGDFTTLGGVPRNRLGLIQLNGGTDTAVDTSGGNGADGSVTAIKILQHGTGGVVVGGSFTHIGGLAAKLLARLDAHLVFDPSFQAGGATGIRSATASRRPGRHFSSQRRTAETELNDDGPSSAAILAVDEEVSGKLVIGGVFTRVGDALRNAVARLNPGGDVDLSYDPGSGTDGPVRALQLAVDPDAGVGGGPNVQKAVIGGDFASVDNIPRTAIARLLGDVPVTVSVLVTTRVATVIPRSKAFVTVSRTGSTTTALTVNYSVQGNAVGGRDYKSLPGFVTIPAGESAVRIKIKPRDAGSPQPNKKVVLKFASSGDYSIVGPPKAKIIIDYDPTH